MPATDRRPRLRTRPLPLARLRGGWPAGAESLESRRLLAASPINVATGLVLATGLPVPGLATGVGIGATAQTMPAAGLGTTQVPAGSAFGSSPTGPSTTLSTLPDDSETAVAPASEVARPTPGRSDRISSLIESPEILIIPHLRPAFDDAFVPGPEIRALPPAPVPAPVPAAPAALEAPGRVGPAPLDAPEAAPATKAPISLETWDAALELVSAEFAGGVSSSLESPGRGALAAGAVLAAWGGWHYGPRLEGRSRRRPAPISPAGAGPGGGPGR